MAALSFTRAQLLAALAAAPGGVLSAFEAHRLAFSDYSTGPRWQGKKSDCLRRMMLAGLVGPAGADGRGEPTWFITDAGRRALTATRRRAA